MNQYTEQEAIPIRELSRLTGINSVTLRAWERRYGLLKPLRTPSGHRLYRLEDIARVNQIQTWLKRGLAISKVRALLDSDDLPVDDIVEPVWSGMATQLLATLNSLHRRKADALLAEWSRLYPVAVLVDELFAPLLTRLALEERDGESVRYLFLDTLLRDYFTSALFRARQQASGPALLLLDAGNSSVVGTLALILSYALSVQGVRVECLPLLSYAGCLMACERLDAKGLLIYADRQNRQMMTLLTECAAHLDLPVWQGGKVASLEKLSVSGSVNLGNNHQALMQGVIEQLGHVQTPLQEL